MDYTPEQLRYPIGKFSPPKEISESQVSGWISEIEAYPGKLRAAVTGLNESQLDTPYRDEGWTLRQVVHHIADSHMNAYVRYKLAMTEDAPVIRPYKEKLWAECLEAKTAEPDVSLDLIGAIHRRLAMFLRTLKSSDFERTYSNPETGMVYTLKQACGLYAWHGEHHLQHILQTRKTNNW